MTSPALPKLKLLYFDIHGLAARIRLACRVGGIPFEDHRFANREEFTALKEAKELPFGQVPLLLVDGQPLAQSGAILRYVCMLGGLHPTDALAAARVDAALASETDAFSAYTALRYRERSGLAELSEEAVLTAELAQREQVFPKHLRQLEAMLEHSQSGWIADSKGPAACDFAWGTQLRELQAGNLCWLQPALLEGRRTMAFLDKFMALPEVAAYYAEKP